MQTVPRATTAQWALTKTKQQDMSLKLLHSLILIGIAALTDMGKAVAEENGGKPTKGKPADDDETPAPTKAAKSKKPVVDDDDDDETPPPAKAAKSKKPVADDDDDKPFGVDEEEEDLTTKALAVSRALVTADPGNKAAIQKLLKALGAARIAEIEEDDLPGFIKNLNKLK